MSYFNKSNCILCLLFVSVSVSGTSVSGKVNDWENPEVVGINKLPPRASFFSFINEIEAGNGKEQASNFLSLNGLWKFKLVDKPADIITDFHQNQFEGRFEGNVEESFEGHFKNYVKDNDWDNIFVPIPSYILACFPKKLFRSGKSLGSINFCTAFNECNIFTQTHVLETKVSKHPSPFSSEVACHDIVVYNSIMYLYC